MLERGRIQIYCWLQTFLIAGSGQQAVFHPGQADGAHLWDGEDQGLRDGQVPEESHPLVLVQLFCLSPIPEVGPRGPEVVFVIKIKFFFLIFMTTLCLAMKNLKEIIKYRRRKRLFFFFLPLGISSTKTSSVKGTWLLLYPKNGAFINLTGDLEQW